MTYTASTNWVVSVTCNDFVLLVKNQKKAQWTIQTSPVVKGAIKANHKFGSFEELPGYNNTDTTFKTKLTQISYMMRNTEKRHVTNYLLLHPTVV